MPRPKKPAPIIPDELKNHPFIQLLKALDISGIRKHYTAQQVKEAQKLTAKSRRPAILAAMYGGVDLPTISPFQLRDLLEGKKPLTENWLLDLATVYILVPETFVKSTELFHEHRELQDDGEDITRENFMRLGHEYMQAQAKVFPVPPAADAPSAPPTSSSATAEKRKEKTNWDSPLAVTLFRILERHGVLTLGGGGVEETERYITNGSHHLLAHMLQGQFKNSWENNVRILKALPAYLHASTAETVLLMRAYLAFQSTEDSPEAKAEAARVIELANNIAHWAPEGDLPGISGTRRGLRAISNIAIGSGSAKQNLEALRQTKRKDSTSPAAEFAVLVECMMALTRGHSENRGEDNNALLERIVDQSIWQDYKDPRIKESELTDRIKSALSALLAPAQEAIADAEQAIKAGKAAISNTEKDRNQRLLRKDEAARQLAQINRGLRETHRGIWTFFIETEYNKQLLGKPQKELEEALLDKDRIRAIARSVTDIAAAAR